MKDELLNDLIIFGVLALSGYYVYQSILTLFGPDIAKSISANSNFDTSISPLVISPNSNGITTNQNALVTIMGG